MTIVDLSTVVSNHDFIGATGLIGQFNNKFVDVDLSQSKISVIPVNAFHRTDVRSIKFPDVPNLEISRQAFKGSKLVDCTLPPGTLVHDRAFAEITTLGTIIIKRAVEFKNDVFALSRIQVVRFEGEQSLPFESNIFSGERCEIGLVEDDNCLYSIAGKLFANADITTVSLPCLTGLRTETFEFATVVELITPKLIVIPDSFCLAGWMGLQRVHLPCLTDKCLDVFSANGPIEYTVCESGKIPIKTLSKATKLFFGVGVGQISQRNEEDDDLVSEVLELYTLTEIVGLNVERINQPVFSNCSTLGVVDFPKLYHLCDECFANCANVDPLPLLETAQSFGNNCLVATLALDANVVNMTCSFLGYEILGGGRIGRLVLTIINDDPLMISLDRDAFDRVVILNYVPVSDCITSLETLPRIATAHTYDLSGLVALECVHLDGTILQDIVFPDQNLIIYDLGAPTITEYIHPNHVIEWEALSDCPRLQEVDAIFQNESGFPGGAYPLPDTVHKVTIRGTRIPAYTFENCKNLRDVVLDETVKTIGHNAFNGCQSIMSIDFSNIHELGGHAIGDTGITELFFKHLKRLSADAFAGSKLKRLAFSTLPEEVTIDIFDRFRSTHGPFEFMNARAIETVYLEDRVQFEKITVKGYNRTPFDFKYTTFDEYAPPLSRYLDPELRNKVENTYKDIRHILKGRGSQLSQEMIEYIFKFLGLSELLTIADKKQIVWAPRIKVAIESEYNHTP